MGRVIHVHVHRRRTRDAAPLPALYRDLVRRLLDAVAEVDARAARTGDDFEGHKFHGNQWVKVASGPKPTKASSKNAKEAMYELFTSGHAFSKEEFLAAVPDLKPKKLTDYLAMLKNPKYAGPKGALSIEKNKDGLYYVALPDGLQAPVPAEEVDAEPTTPEQQAEYDAKLDAAIKHHGDVPVAAPPPAPAEKPAPAEGIPALLAQHPGSMPKGEADKHYEAAVDVAYWSMVQSKADAQTAAQNFKNDKATAMAAWAQAVKGSPFVPKPQDVFKADLQLVADAKTFGKAAALNNWKVNTAAEKMGNFPPNAAPVSKTATHHAPAPVADMGHPAPVEPVPYESIVPESFVPIGEEDIVGGKFSKGIGSLKSLLEQTSAENAVANKKSVEHKLRDRLKDRPNFQALVKRLGLAKEGGMSLEARLVAAWAGSSGDHHDISVALQLAARDAFGIPDGHIEKKALGSLQVHANNEAKVTSSGIHALNPNMTALADHEVPTAKAALQEFVQAQYEETQELLKGLGRDHVYLARGMKFSAGHDPADGPAALKLQPASSFSTQYSTAKSFSGGGTVFLVKVPRQQVLSTYVTGFGCTSEHEVVVLAHDKMRAFAVASSAASGHSQAEEYVAGKIALKKAGIGPAGKLTEYAKGKPVKAPAAAHVIVNKQTGKVTHVSGTHAEKLAAAKKAVVNAVSKHSKTAKLAKQTGSLHYVSKANKYEAEVDEAKAYYNELKGKK